VLAERDRIGRDLHDFAIQQLFATGMALDAAKQKVAQGQADPVAIESLIDSSLASIDEAARASSSIVFVRWARIRRARTATRAKKIRARATAIGSV